VPVLDRVGTAGAAGVAAYDAWRNFNDQPEPRIEGASRGKLVVGALRSGMRTGMTTGMERGMDEAAEKLGEAAAV
jgi:hypothetical protein